MTTNPQTVFDDANGMQVLALAALRADLGASRDPLQRLPLMAAILQAYGQAPATGPRQSMAHLYGYDQDRKPAQRKRENAAAMALLRQIDAGEVDPAALSDDQKAALAKYSGTGGALIGADGKKGSAHEYFTPLPVAEGAWNVLKELGFAGGKVLDPCGGTGVFGAAAPSNAVMDVVELNATSGRVNQLVNGGPGYSVTISPFERVAASTPDEEYDAVITNVPFGGVADRGGNQLLDPRYQNEPLQNYFILRCLEKLKPGGVAAFLTPPRCVSGKDTKEKGLRETASYMAEFVGAFRLPNSVFGTAGADTMTDVMFFRKYSREVLERIQELRAQAPEVLAQAGVLWDEYLQGDYFKGEGQRFVLGKFVPKDPTKYRDVDRVVSNASVGEIGKLLHKLPGSRIDWQALEAAQTSPLVYKDGDTLHQAGQTLQMQDGAWVPVVGDQAGQRDMLTAQLHVTSPYAAFEAGVSLQAAKDVLAHMVTMGQALDVPGWLRATLKDLMGLDASLQGSYWSAAVVGLAAEQVMDERAHDGEVVNYQQDYAALSSAMQANWSVAKRSASVKGATAKRGLRVITTQYDKKTGFSAFWRGDVAATIAPSIHSTKEHGLEGIRYQLKSMSIPLDRAREVMGADFDPLTTDDFCISGDGQSITPASDYYSGNYGDFLRRINAEIASATDEGIKAKLLRQKLMADTRIERVDVTKLEFNLFSPHVTAEEKAEFLRRFVHPESVVVYDEATGKARPDIQISKTGKGGRDLTDREKLMNRVGDYLKNGTITLGTAQLGMDTTTALRELSSMVRQANEQFNAWARGNRTITDRLGAVANDPDRLRFERVDTEDALNIPGLSGRIALHGYQNAYVRQQAREFGGGNGFDVGLGKTATALAAVQYVQSIGVKKKTAFVVPGSVLAKWRKEALKMFAGVEDSLFIGLREVAPGEFKTNPALYDEDLLRIRENRHSKIYMTGEAFERLRLRDETIARFGDFMRSVDLSFAEVQDKKQDERNKGRAAGFVAILADKSGSAPYLEDLGLDSLVVDEGHAYKNSSETSEFKGGKYLSNAPSSKRGLDMQAKAWYIRGQSDRKDGVLVLTASPITNSPLEIYSMLALAVGHERINDMLLGSKGADQFMQMMCQIDTESDTTMDGIERETNVFTGLNNVEVLRKVMNSVFTIKTAADVGAAIVAPDKSEQTSNITLTPEIKERLGLYKQAFRYAIDVLSEKSDPRGSKEAFDQVQAHFGEPMELIGHPFNLINKMNALILDPELDQRASFYTVPQGKEKAVQALLAAFNAKKESEVRPRLDPSVPADAVLAHKIKKADNGGETHEYKVHVRAVALEPTRVRLDTISPEIQSKFEAMAEKAGIELDVTISPKVAALLDNYTKERAHPRGIDASGNKSPLVKQIVFCDVLPMHNKLKRILSKRGGTPSAAIAIITGKINNTAEEILAVQDGFNAHGEDNKYQSVIANEKAEVGIDLQIGTQAIHHLTIGWTPDSLQQRDGRGVRQGNRTGYVNVYAYDAEGTFDVAKRTMVRRKSAWITQVMDVHGGNRVQVSGGMTADQITALIESVGDADGMRKAQEEADAREAQSRASSNQERQRINIDTIRKQRAYIDGNPDAKNLAIKKVLAIRTLALQADELRRRIALPTATATAVARNEALLSDVTARLQGLREQFAQGAQLVSDKGEVLDLDAYLQTEGRNYKGPRTDADLSEQLRRGWGTYKLRIVEGAAIHAEWEAEIGMAQALIDQSTRAYEQQAEAKGAYNKLLAQAFADGKAAMHGKHMLAQGAFARAGEWIAVLGMEDGRAMWRYLRSGSATSDYLHGAPDDAEFINPGDDGYDALLRYVARLEDDASATSNPITVFSDAAPEVLEYRTTAVRKLYSRNRYALPAPHFPIVIPPSAVGESPLLARIVDDQKAVVLEHVAGGFIVDAGVEVTTDLPSKQKSLIGYAISKGLLLSKLDVDGSSAYSLGGVIAENITIPVEPIEASFAEAFAGEKTEAQLSEAALAVIAKLVPWLDLGSFEFGASGTSDLLLRLDGSIKGVWHKYNSAVQMARSRERQRVEAARAQSAEAQKADDALQGEPATQADDGEFVGVSGDTRPWKEQIKSAAGAGGFRWDGNANVWNIKRSAWNKLLASYPACAQALQAGPASKKLPK